MSFSVALRSQADFRLDVKRRKVCPTAREFAAWSDRLYSHVIQEPKPQSVSLALRLLQDKYMELKSLVPNACKYHVRSTGHRCIYHVWNDAYLKLRSAELTLVLLPKTLKEARKDEIPGIFLGERVVD